MPRGEAQRLSPVLPMAITSISFERGVAGWARLPDAGLPEVAFVGRSNVGKSSLINMLAGRKSLARTSRTPGKTRELNFYLVNEMLYFVDLPGYGYASVARKQRLGWTRLTVRYLQHRPELRATLLLVDGRHPPMEQDLETAAMLRSLDAPWLVVLTKADKLSSNQQRNSLVRAGKVLAAEGLEVPILGASAKTGDGRSELLSWLKDLAAL